MNFFQTLFTILILLVATSCSSGVKYYEKGNLQDPIMKFDSDPGETHFRQKCQYSREGAVGGIGSSAGGGCGCY